MCRNRAERVGHGVVVPDGLRQQHGSRSGESIADPVLVLALHEGKMLFPDTAAAIEATPDWAKPLVEAVLSKRG